MVGLSMLPVGVHAVDVEGVEVRRECAECEPKVSALLQGVRVLGLMSLVAPEFGVASRGRNVFVGTEHPATTSVVATPAASRRRSTGDTPGRGR